MKPKQIKLIKDLYKSADYEQKEKIKECFPELWNELLDDWQKLAIQASLKNDESAKIEQLKSNEVILEIDGKRIKITLID
jgi:hypothetical protein